MTRLHGGQDAQGLARWDFSTNANACGPCPTAWADVQAADATHYPDPQYTQLRQQLADFHGVDAERIVLLASASEGIMRLTQWSRQQGGLTVQWPAHAYGDYAHAAQLWGLEAVAADASGADVQWLCEPSSPLGQAHAMPAPRVGSTVVLDRAYEPLRLTGTPSFSPAQCQSLWQLWTPNKALGLTGIRGAYAIAPWGAQSAVRALQDLAPSWPLGAHAVAMLGAWVQPATQTWLAHSRKILAAWKQQQVQGLQQLGWHCLPSEANYFCAQPPQPLDALALRAQDIKVRDCSSFGLPGHYRLSVQSPAAQHVLMQTLRRLSATETSSFSTESLHV